jgi:hypothetical protein
MRTIKGSICMGQGSRGDSERRARERLVNAFVWIICIASILFFWRERIAGSAEDEPDVIRCRSISADIFRVQGPDGQSAGVLRRGDFMLSSLMLGIGPRQVSMTIGLRADSESSLNLAAPHGGSSIDLATHTDPGKTGFWIRRGVADEIGLTSWGDGDATIRMPNSNTGRSDRITLAVAMSGPKLWFADRQGKLRLALTATTNGDGAFLYDDAARARSSMFNRLEESGLYFMDHQKRTRLELTGFPDGRTAIRLRNPDQNEDNSLW